LLESSESTSFLLAPFQWMSSVHDLYPTAKKKPRVQGDQNAHMSSSVSQIVFWLQLAPYSQRVLVRRISRQSLHISQRWVPRKTFKEWVAMDHLSAW
jgi:hypothetical protein